MKSETYFEQMRETSELVDNIIFSALEPLKQQNPEMYKSVVTLPEKRRGLPKARAHLARLVYGICRPNYIKGEWADLSASVELELNAMYYRNQFYDKKAGILNREDIIKNSLSADYSRDLAQEVLEKSNYLEKEKLVEILREADVNCSRGFWIDIFENTYPNMKDCSFDSQILLNNKRLYLMNASFFEKIAQMAVISAGEKDFSKIIALSNFGKEYGMIIQGINDIADFVPPKENLGTTEKTRSDAYRDIKAQKMTQPIIWLLNNGSPGDKKCLRSIFEIGENATLDDLENLTKILVKSGAIDFAKHNVMEFARRAKQNLKTAFLRDERKYLSPMCFMAKRNRYYDALKKYK